MLHRSRNESEVQKLAYASVFQIPYVTWFFVHNYLPVLGIVAVSGPALANKIGSDTTATLLSGSFGYVPGSAGSHAAQTSSSSTHPPTRTSSHRARTYRCRVGVVPAVAGRSLGCARACLGCGGAGALNLLAVTDASSAGHPSHHARLARPVTEDAHVEPRPLFRHDLRPPRGSPTIWKTRPSSGTRQQTAIHQSLIGRRRPRFSV